MSKNIHHCPFCGDELVEVEVSVNGKSNWPVTYLDPGLLIRPARDPSQLVPSNDPEEEWSRDKQWVSILELKRIAAGLYCNRCGALTIAPSIPAHRKELGLEP